MARARSFLVGSGGSQGTPFLQSFVLTSCESQWPHGPGLLGRSHPHAEGARMEGPEPEVRGDLPGGGTGTVPSKGLWGGGD